MTGNEIRTAMITAREEYIKMIKAELMGPGSEFSLPDEDHEIVSAKPTSRYSVGILFPQGNIVNHDNDETLPTEEENDSENDKDDNSGIKDAEPAEPKAERKDKFLLTKMYPMSRTTMIFRGSKNLPDMI